MPVSGRIGRGSRSVDLLRLVLEDVVELAEAPVAGRCPLELIRLAVIMNDRAEMLRACRQAGPRRRSAPARQLDRPKNAGRVIRLDHVEPPVDRPLVIFDRLVRPKGIGEDGQAGRVAAVDEVPREDPPGDVHPVRSQVASEALDESRISQGGQAMDPGIPSLDLAQKIQAPVHHGLVDQVMLFEQGDELVGETSFASM